MQRRNFVKTFAAGLSVVPLALQTAQAMNNKKIGLQLYTLRDALKTDLMGTLEKVAKIGYKEVELFGYNDGKFFGKSAAEFRQILDGFGLKAVSGHYLAGIAMKDMKGTVANGWEQAVADANTMGQKYMICAYLFPDERKKLDDYKRYAEMFNKAGQTCKSGGIQFGYHNHDFEFKALEEQIPYDILLSQTDKNLVKMELDLYWVTKAGLDPVNLFEKSPGRYPLWHIKDMDKTDQSFAEVGTGSIDFARIFAKKHVAGLKNYFVEQDVCKRPAIDCITTSFENLNKMKK
jgi:sugar phosphate isomerase/epimerase